MGEPLSSAAETLTRELFVELAARELASRQIQQSYDQSASGSLLASLINSNNNNQSSALMSSGDAAAIVSSIYGVLGQQPQQQQQQQQALPFASQQGAATLETVLSRYLVDSTTRSLDESALQQNQDQQQLQLVALLLQHVRGQAGRGGNEDANNNVE